MKRTFPTLSILVALLWGTVAWAAGDFPLFNLAKGSKLKLYVSANVGAREEAEGVPERASTPRALYGGLLGNPRLDKAAVEEAVTMGKARRSRGTSGAGWAPGTGSRDASVTSWPRVVRLGEGVAAVRGGPGRARGRQPPRAGRLQRCRHGWRS